MCKKVTPQEYETYLKVDARGFRVLEDYVNNKTKIKHQCSKGHIWEVKPRDIKSGHGCPICAASGFDPEKEATLYYLSINNGNAYKIGTTNRTVEERFSKEEFKNITVLDEWFFKSGQEARKKEQEILKEFKWAQYNGEHLLKTDHTEMFIVDVLNKDVYNG